MSSSTSSSDPRRRGRFGSEWLVVGTALTAVLAVEAGLRVFQDSLSGDVAHMNAAHSIVASLAESDGIRVLMFGNSLLYRGVDPAQLESLLEADLGRQVSIGMVFPDGTLPMEWSYLYRKLVFNTGRLPDVMVMAFGPGHLGDRSPAPQLLRLAAHHVDTRDIGLLFEEDLTRFEDRSEFLIARASTLFALRDRVAPRVFDRIIPEYRTLAPTLLQIPSGAAQASDAPRGPTFVYLERLLDDASSHGVPLIALPMPAPELYDVEAEAVSELASHGDPLLPTLVDIGLEPERFYDGQHLDPIGRARFTEFLAPILAAAIAQLEL